MINVWQYCLGNYKPADVFEQGKVIVIARNIHWQESEFENEEGCWAWEECRIPQREFLNALSAIDNQTSDSIFDLASLADENSGAIDELADLVDSLVNQCDELNTRLSAVENGGV